MPHIDISLNPHSKASAEILASLICQREEAVAAKDSAKRQLVEARKVVSVPSL